MSVSFYHILHLLALLSMVSTMTVILTQKEQSKLANMLFGISTLVMLVAGFGMLTKLGYGMSSTWVIGKLLIWVVVAMGVPWISKRVPSRKRAAFITGIFLVVVAVLLAVLKP